MKKYAVILIVLILPLFLAGCTKKEAQEAGGILTDDTDTQKEETVKGSIFDIMNTGRSSKCTATVKNEGGMMEMTVYTSGKKMYSETKIDVPDMPEESYTSYSIVDDEYMYSWSDAGMAYKTKLSEFEEMAEDLDLDAEEQKENMEMAKKMQDEIDYRCMPWVPNPAMFTPPSDVNFLDMDETMDSMMDSVETGDFSDMMDAACDICESLPTADAVAECKANAGC